LRWRHVGPPREAGYSAGSRVNSRGIRRPETGGSIGIWHFFPNPDKYVEGLKEMADVVGVDHVSIGTDQQVAPGSAGLFAMGTARSGDAALWFYIGRGR
jgi:hypothetical protein